MNLLDLSDGTKNRKSLDVLDFCLLQCAEQCESSTLNDVKINRTVDKSCGVKTLNRLI